MLLLMAQLNLQNIFPEYRLKHPEILMRSVQDLTPIPHEWQTTAASCGLSKKQFPKKPNNIIGGRVVSYEGVIMC